MLNATTDELAKASKDIQSIIGIIDERSKSGISLDFNLETMHFGNFTFALLNSEFFEQVNLLSNSFADALDYVYPYISPSSSSSAISITKEGDKGKEIRRVTCQEIKFKFFANGDSNTNILLKFFMSMNDYNAELIRPCLDYNLQPDYSRIGSRFNFNIENDIKEWRKGLKTNENFFPIPIMKYASDSIMNLIWLNGMKILVKDKTDFYELFQRLNEAGLLKVEIIESIVEFQNSVNGKTMGWSLDSFDSFSKNHQEYFFENEKFDFMNKCRKLFNLPPISLKSFDSKAASSKWKNYKKSCPLKFIKIISKNGNFMIKKVPKACNQIKSIINNSRLSLIKRLTLKK